MVTTGGSLVDTAVGAEGVSASSRNFCVGDVCGEVGSGVHGSV